MKGLFVGLGEIRAADDSLDHVVGRHNFLIRLAVLQVVLVGILETLVVVDKLVTGYHTSLAQLEFYFIAILITINSPQSYNRKFYNLNMSAFNIRQVICSRLGKSYMYNLKKKPTLEQQSLLIEKLFSS